MPFSGGIFQRLFNWATDRNGGIKILADRMDGEFNNYASAINDIVNGTQPFTGTVKAPYGTVSAPGFQFSGDGDTGLVRTGADTLALATGGVARFTANTTALTSTLPLSLPVGSAATPAANWNTNDGFYSPSAGVMALSLGGVERLRWTATGQSGAIAPIAGTDRYRIINGDFAVNQSGVTSGSALSAASYPVANVTSGRGPDGFYAIRYTTDTVSFGTAAGYRKNSQALSLACSGPFSGSSTIAAFVHRIENAATYEGQTITLFLRMFGFTTHDVSVSYRQYFGTGGSPSADVSGHVGKTTLASGWNPYKFTFAVPSVSAKTFGTNGNDYLEIVYWIAAGSNYTALTNGLSSSNRTVYFSDLHERVGDVPIEAINYYQSPDPQIELGRCQRYFEVLINSMRVSSAAPLTGQATFATQKRAVPTLSDITLSTGSGVTFNASKTSMTQTGFNSVSANVNTISASAEL